MISSIIDMVLLAALAGTSAAVLLMYRRLRRFDALQGEAAREFARSADALDKARAAIAGLHDEGGGLAVTLAGRMNEARLVLNEIEDATERTRAAFVDIVEHGSDRPSPPRRPAATDEAMPSPVAEAQLQPTAVKEPVAQASLAPSKPLTAEEPRAPSAAERIRDAARARIAAAKERGAHVLTASTPVPPSHATLGAFPAVRQAAERVGPGLNIASGPTAAASRPLAPDALSSLPVGSATVLVGPNKSRADDLEDGCLGDGLAAAALAGRQLAKATALTWSDLATAARTA
ncbi:hypothetical protein [Acuticoccus sp.]|uniref:hypothetical protein n=1 Tax=Acuticoccus sp. TaxID=1904378 RepID=UPI003B52230C